MLYKVTPMMVPAKADKTKKPATPRKKRKSAVFDGEGNEVLITLMCLKCRSIKPLVQFGLRRMGDGVIRNQPWCRPCRSGARADPAEVAAKPLTPALDVQEPISAAQTDSEVIPFPLVVAEALGLSEDMGHSEETLKGASAELPSGEMELASENEQRPVG